MTTMMMVVCRVSLVVLTLLVIAETCQVVYLAKRLGRCLNRHRVLLRSGHYALAAVAISSKVLLPAVVVSAVGEANGWVTSWMATAVLIVMLLSRAKRIEQNQELIDQLTEKGL